ncbi:MAG: reverse gyrase [Brevinematales bacterium]|nr:reverse gyrase [Brevinematales bacterium]
MRAHSIYLRGCVSCGSEITDDRLISIGVCERCYKNGLDENIEKVFRQIGVSGNLSEILYVKDILEKWINNFKKAVNSEPWNTQISWMKRVILKRSFSLIAPTGVGKTTFGIMTSLNLYSEGKKSVIILPTTSLVNQVYEKLQGLSSTIGVSPRIVMYSSKITRKQKENFKKAIQKEDYDIVVITSSMIKNLFTIRENIKFDFIFADDVDALVKKSKNVEYVIMLSGLSKEDVEVTLEVIKLKFLLAVSRGKERYENYLDNYNKLQERVLSIKNKEKGIIVVSSATAKPKGVRIKLFKELFDFEIGGKTEITRNINNYYIFSENYEQDLIKVLSIMGDGGIVFVTTEDGVEYAEKVSEIINSKTSLKSAVISSNKRDEVLKKFRKGEINILVGVSTYYGTLVRGIDIPDRIIYAVFLGIPRFKVVVDVNNLNLSGYTVMKILAELIDYIKDEKQKKKVQSLITKLKNNSKYEFIVNQVNELLRDLLSKDEYIDILKNSQDILFQSYNGRNYIVIPDMNTYLQASGRTSRLYIGGMTKGISIVIEKDNKLLEIVSRKYKWIEDSEWVKFEESRVLEDLKVAKEDREKLSLAIEGNVQSNIKQLNKTVLIIVESPTKAKTISRLLGNPTERIIKGLSCYETTTGSVTFIITASKGHMFELTMDNEDIYGIRIKEGIPLPVYDTIKRCSKCRKTFVSSENRCVYCGNDKFSDRIDDVRSLIELAKEVDEVLLASDPDTEGEKISYDIYSFLVPYLKFFNGKVRRMRFNEVTYYAINRSIQNPEEININLVESQLLRRVQDRIIGFGLSGILKDELNHDNISAGRVQSPVLGWIIERFKQYNDSKTNFVEITLSTDLSESNSKTTEEIVLSVEGNKKTLDIKVGDEVSVKIDEEKEIEILPLPPFTTDAILIQANRLYKMSSDMVMNILQDLFEEGLITYHRTDSTKVSLVGQQVAKEYLSIKNIKNLNVPRSWEEEGTHECIRPTKSIDAQTLYQLTTEGAISTSTIKRHHVLIYDLIFKRFISSQMKAVVVKNVTYSILVSDIELKVNRNVEVVDNGWNMMGYFQIDEPLPNSLKIKNVKSVKKPKVSLFSEGDIIQMMKDKGIGRPSTYSKIISTLLKRGYIISKNNRLIPMSKGFKVYEVLKSRYSDFISEDRTRSLEAIMDKVEKGQKDYFAALDEIIREAKDIIPEDIN